MCFLQHVLSSGKCRCVSTDAVSFPLRGVDAARQKITRVPGKRTTRVYAPLKKRCSFIPAAKGT